MAFFMPPASYMERTPSSSMLPRRSDSLTAAPRAGAKPAAPAKPSVFQLVDDDLRDARRVVTHGQEDDLRTALTRMMSRVEEIVSAFPLPLAASCAESYDPSRTTPPLAPRIRPKR
jgi:hypothetical protein